MSAVGMVQPLQGYKRHIVSEFLQDRYPYLEDINSHLKQDDVSMAFGERLFPRLVDQLKTPDLAPERLSEALCTICDLCAHQENKCLAVASNVVAAATNLLMHDSVEVRREAARVISSMAKMIGGRGCMPIGNTQMSRKLTGTVAPGPTLPRLSKLLLGCDDEIVKQNVAEALCSMTFFRDGCQQVVDQGAVKATTQYLCVNLPDVPATRHLALCLLNLLRTLASVTMYANNGMRDVLGQGLIMKIIVFLGRIEQEWGIKSIKLEESTDTVRQALRTLWHCGNDPQGRREMLKADGVRFISLYLSNSDAKVREAATCALNVVSLETNGKEDILKHSTEALASLMKSRQETTYLHETCVQLCRCASELPAFRFAFARHIVMDVWLLEKVYGTTALSAVSPLLEDKEENEIRTQAAVVMSHFLRKKVPEQGDLIRVPPVCPLRYINQPALYAFEECTGVMHNLVALLNVAPDPALECLDALTDARAPREKLRWILDEDRIQLSAEIISTLVDSFLEKTTDQEVVDKPPKRTIQRSCTPKAL